MHRSAAESLIRGQDGDVSLGWDVGARRRAAVLCFDEMQVTDPFAAVALKGRLHSFQLAPVCALYQMLVHVRRPTACLLHTRLLHAKLTSPGTWLLVHQQHAIL